MGVILLFRPIISTTIYVISYIAYYYSIAIVVAESEMLLSYKVNGTTVVGISFLVSAMIWHYQYLNLSKSIVLMLSKSS